MDELNIEIKTHMVLVALVIISAINWGLQPFGYNLVEAFSNFVNSLFKTNLEIKNVIYIVYGLAGILLASKRTTWLPFLGKSVLPSYLVPLLKNKNTNKDIVIKTKPNSKIAYWASFNKSKNQDVITAYDDYSNSGVVMSDKDGKAVLSIKEGAGYSVPSNKIITRHVHYRIIEPSAMMDVVETIKY